MTATVFSTSAARQVLDPREVDRLINYAMGKLEGERMSFLNDNKQLVCVGTSRGKIARLVKDSLRIFGYEKARQTIDEHIENLIEVERESYKRGKTAPSHKKNAPDAGQGVEGE